MAQFRRSAGTTTGTTPENPQSSALEWPARIDLLARTIAKAVELAYLRNIGSEEE